MRKHSIWTREFHFVLTVKRIKQRKGEKKDEDLEESKLMKPWKDLKLGVV